jgi:hypothetical protein
MRRRQYFDRGRMPRKPRYFALFTAPPASPALAPEVRKQKTASTDYSTRYFLQESGAGEGIRTLDPNLGKLVLNVGKRLRMTPLACRFKSG